MAIHGTVAMKDGSCKDVRIGEDETDPVFCFTDLLIHLSAERQQKKAAKAGYVYKDKVKMRKGPATTYEVVRDAIPKNTAVTLYELQEGWWFLKCGSKYGYIRKDMIKEGEPKTAAVESTDLPSGSFEGTIKTNSVAALRKGPSKSSKAIKEMTNGTKVTLAS